MFVAVAVPPTTKLPPIPTPPNGTVNAPVAVVPACSVPTTIMSVAVTYPPTTKLPPMPTPPYGTCNAPVAVVAA